MRALAVPHEFMTDLPFTTYSLHTARCLMCTPAGLLKPLLDIGAWWQMHLVHDASRHVLTGSAIHAAAGASQK